EEVALRLFDVGWGFGRDAARNLEGDAGAAVLRGSNFKRAAKAIHTFADAAQAEGLRLSHVMFRYAAAVVADLQGNGIVFAAQAQRDQRSVGVLGDIGECFLDDAEQ